MNAKKKVNILQNKGKEIEKLKRRKGTHKHTETYLKYFDGHRCLSQSEESECIRTHGKDGITREFLKDATRGCEKGREERKYILLDIYL